MKEFVIKNPEQGNSLDKIAHELLKPCQKSITSRRKAIQNAVTPVDVLHAFATPPDSYELGLIDRLHQLIDQNPIMGGNASLQTPPIPTDPIRYIEGVNAVNEHCNERTKLRDLLLLLGAVSNEKSVLEFISQNFDTQQTN